MKLNRIWLTGGLLTLLPFGAARADILTLQGDKVVKGVMDEAGSDSASVKFTSSAGTQKIYRERIKHIQPEPAAQGYTHIGDEYKAQNKLGEALKAYQQALQKDADFKPAQEGMKAVQEAMDAQKKAMRQDAIGEIDKLKAQIEQAIKIGDFAKCEELLKTASDHLPTAEQKVQLQELVCELYLAWAKDRLDKFDRPGAEVKLNLALAARPENDEVIETLLKLWEGQPEKQEQMFHIYETVLSRRSDDMVLRRKLADMYFAANRFEDSAGHYLTLYKASKKFKGTDLEARLAENLDRLHAQFAAKKDFDRAIYFYKLMETIDPKSDPSVLNYYEFLKRANDVKPGDLDGRLGVADFAENNGLEQEAVEIYRQIIAQAPDNEKAKAALDRFALRLIEQAQASFNQQDYYLAKAFADQVTREYPNSQEAGLRAQQIIGAANNEIARDSREKREKALQYVQRGDTYYEQAMQFYRDIFDIQQKGNRLSNPKSDARRYFQYAIDAYQAALQIDPSLKSDPASLVGPRLDESKRYLQRLTAGPPPSRQNKSREIGPNTTNLREDATGRLQ